MNRIACYTSITFSYLDRARILAETVKKYHPDWDIFLLMSDAPPDGFVFRLEDENFDHLILLENLGIGEWRKWMFGHDIVELCTAVKGIALDRLLKQGYDRVIYLDPDTALFSPLEEMLELLARRSVVFTPHVTTPATMLHDVIDNEISSLQHGVYNLGFVAVNNVPAGRAFAEWWRDRLLAFCHDDVPNGLFTDQRWCDLAPALFEDVGILRHTGYNVASWNIGNRPISINSDGTIQAGEMDLRFFHFTKVNTVGESMLERYSYGRTEVFELLRWYRAQLQRHKAVGLPSGWWAYGKYANGDPIERRHRLMWRGRDDLKQHFQNPFDVGRGSFHEWCRDHFS